MGRKSRGSTGKRRSGGKRRSADKAACPVKAAEGNDPQEVDEGFSSRPSSSASSRRPSSSSSSEDEVFWGAGLKSAKCAEATDRLRAYEVKFGEGVQQWSEFKKSYGPLPSSSKYRKLNGGGSEEGENDVDDESDGGGVGSV